MGFLIDHSKVIPALAIPAYLSQLSAAVLAGLSTEVLLAILEDMHRGSEHTLLPVALRFQDSLRRALVVQTDNFEMLKDTEWSLQNVKQCRQLLLTVLGPLPEGLPDDPPTQVETTTKTTLP